MTVLAYRKKPMVGKTISVRSGSVPELLGSVLSVRFVFICFSVRFGSKLFRFGSVPLGSKYFGSVRFGSKILRSTSKKRSKIN